MRILPKIIGPKTPANNAKNNITRGGIAGEIRLIVMIVDAVKKTWNR